MLLINFQFFSKNNRFGFQYLKIKMQFVKMISKLYEVDAGVGLENVWMTYISRRRNICTRLVLRCSAQTLQLLWWRENLSKKSGC